jgi:hypothetical protein
MASNPAALSLSRVTAAFPATEYAHSVETFDIIQTKKPWLICQLRILYYPFGFFRNGFFLISFTMYIFIPNVLFFIRTFIIPLMRALPPPDSPFRKFKLFRYINQFPAGKIHSLRLLYSLIQALWP